mmetsp:Transcript_10656/g.13204  ORF Transcript_10656/g.13204 Transcript_10656/m.13204 type:complete len:83 (+) Transcript_10656:439-687(+)
MYPMQKMRPWREINHVTKFTPIKDTSFENMITGVYYASGQKICLAKPLQQVPEAYDTMLGTQNCPNLHKFHTSDFHDDEGLE